MSIFTFRNIPSFFMEKLIAVREPIDNLWNVLVVIEAINSNPDCLVNDDQNNFDINVFTSNFSRFLIRKDDGYFSMYNPFHVLLQDNHLSFNYDPLNEAVSGVFISIIKNAITTSKENSYSHEDIIISLADNFSLDIAESIKYYDAFASLISEEHGYFRFDDDPANSNHHIHPRYHFDIFCKNSAALKVGNPNIADLSTFMALADKTIDKKYLASPTQVL